MSYSTRLGCTLTFDEGVESDVINLVEQLQNSRKLGEMIAHLLRLAVESPEVFEKTSDGKFRPGTITSEMLKLGVTPTRKKFMEDTRKEINAIKEKVDCAYDMSQKVYTLALFGKREGLEDRSRGALIGAFLAEQELNRLMTEFNIRDLNSVFLSNKLEKAKERAEESLEYIAEAYSGVVSEIKAMAQPMAVYMQPADSGYQSSGVLNKLAEADSGELKEPMPNEFHTGDVEDTPEDDFIDFGNADMSALNNFFSGEG